MSNTPTSSATTAASAAVPSSPQTLTGLEFIGHWIGESMVSGRSAVERPAHVWEIHRSNNTLIIRTRWEGEAGPGGYFSVTMPTEVPSFEIKTETHLFVATLVDAQHFIIRNWDTNDTRAGKGAHYDVVFSRPGVAELQARSVWQRHKDALPRARRVRKPTREQEATHHWRAWKRAANRAAANTTSSIGAVLGERAAKKSDVSEDV